MSARAINWAVKQTAGGSVAKVILLLIAEHYSEPDGRAWPSQDTLSREAELSERSVRNGVAALAEAGLIHVELWKRQDGSKVGNRYYLPRYRPEVRRASLDGGPVVVAGEWSQEHGGMVFRRAWDEEVLQGA